MFLTELRSLGGAVAEQSTPQLYHSMVLQLKLRQVPPRRARAATLPVTSESVQAEIEALKLQLKAGAEGGLDLAAVADEEAAVFSLCSP